jgi:hypothetical protein
MTENGDDAGRLNLNEVLAGLKAAQAAVAEAARAMVAAAERQKAMEPAFERLKEAARFCAESARRAELHSLRVKEILAGHVSAENVPEEIPDNGYDTERAESALAAAGRARDLVAEAKLCNTDPEKMALVLGRIRSEHAVIRDWVGEQSIDHPEYDANARLMAKRLSVTEAQLQSSIKWLRSLPPQVRRGLLEADAAMKRIIDKAAE